MYLDYDAYTEMNQFNALDEVPRQKPREDATATNLCGGVEHQPHGKRTKRQNTQPLPEPVQAWCNTDERELFILLDSGKTLQMPVCQVNTHWRTMNLPPDVWQVYLQHRDAMQRLGFRAVKEKNGWELEYSEPRGTVRRRNLTDY